MMFSRFEEIAIVFRFARIALFVAAKGNEFSPEQKAAVAEALEVVGGKMVKFSTAENVVEQCERTLGIGEFASAS